MKAKDIEFLKDLQHTMLTQDTICQASPRFWVVMQTIREYGIEDGYEDGSCIIKDNEVNYEGDILKIIKELIEEGYNIDYVLDNKDIYIDHNKIWDIDELVDYLDETFKVVNYKDKEEIVPNTFFLTNEECKKHIKANHYHYNNPRSYAMTAWRSPQVEKLYNILENTNWDNINIEEEI